MRAFKIATIVLALCLIGLGWFCYSLMGKQGTEVKSGKSALGTLDPVVQKQVKTEATKIAKEVDRNGLQHTVARMANAISPAELASVKADLLDTIDALHIAREKVKQVIAFNVTLAVKNQELSMREDNTGLARNYTYKDKFFNLDVNIPNDSSQVPTFSAGYDADLAATQYNKNRLLFWNDSYIDIYSNDKRFTNKGIRTFTVKPEDPAVVIKTQLTSTYNFRQKELLGGPALSVDLGRFNATGKYLFSPVGNPATVELNGSFNLTRLKF
jgi:hypothetical protein